MSIIEGFFDGCCEPVNPGGHAAWGALLKLDGKVVHAWGNYCGYGPEMSNNFAEYSGALALLREIRMRQEAGLRGPVIIRGDSKLVIMQLTKKWRVLGGLYVPVYRQAADMLAIVFAQADGNVKLEWIPREKNGECDVLSKNELHRRGVRFRLQPEAPPREEALA